MHRTLISPALAAAALSACVLEPELLNSERIEARFGNYGVEILDQNQRIRRSSLYSSEGAVRTCRTYAIVQFANPLANGIETPHKAVKSGQSLGSTFRDAGWSIVKTSLFTGSLSLPDEGGRVSELMRLGSRNDLAMHVYRLDLARDGELIHYADIIEIHHPDYLTVADLQRLYPVSPQDRLGTAALQPFVALVQSD